MNLALAERYQDILNRIENAATTSDDAKKVTLIAVSKTQPVEMIAELYQLGQRDFGENYVQELVEKAEKLDAAGCSEIRWHFIGHLQTNKVKALIPHVYAVHSVDSEKLGHELAKRWAMEHGGAVSASARLPCFLEVNIDCEISKSGVMPANVGMLAQALSGESALSLQGLMAIPAATSDTGAFTRLRELELTCRPYTAGLLSMGMSGDYEAAIRAGATHVRVGTALFGKR